MCVIRLSYAHTHTNNAEWPINIFHQTLSPFWLTVINCNCKYNHDILVNSCWITRFYNHNTMIFAKQQLIAQFFSRDLIFKIKLQGYHFPWDSILERSTAFPAYIFKYYTIGITPITWQEWLNIFFLVDIVIHPVIVNLYPSLPWDRITKPPFHQVRLWRDRPKTVTFPRECAQREHLLHYQTCRISYSLLTLIYTRNIINQS